MFVVNIFRGIFLVKGGEIRLTVSSVHIFFFYLKHSYPTALELVASGKVNVKPLITNRFKLEESHKAFTTSSSPGCNTIKVMISCHEE